MSMKESLLNKLETQRDTWSKQIQRLQADAEERKAKAKDEQAEAEIQKEFSEKIQDLESRLEESRKKLDEVKEASEDRIGELKSSVDNWIAKFTQ